MHRTFADRAICTARAAWYASTEPARLRWTRRRHEGFYRQDWTVVNPLVTIYIPTHNRAELLFERALPSVLAQTYRNLDVIVAMHGHDYETWNRTECLTTVAPIGGARDFRVWLLSVPRVVHWRPSAENKWLAGPVDPSNAALKAARGDWIMRIDDDDVLEPDAVETLLRHAQDHDLEFISARHDTLDGPVEPYVMHGYRVGGVQTWLYRSYLRFFRYNRDCWRKAWNRNNDVDLPLRMLRAGVRFGYLDKTVAHIRPRPGETKVGLAAVREREHLLATHKLGFYIERAES